VTLRGDVKTFAEKVAAERAALGVDGVKAVANDVNVHVPYSATRTDTEVAQAVVTALRWNTMVAHEKITVSVTDDWVTLNGRVDWEYQRTAAADAIRNLPSVRGVTNTISLEPDATVAAGGSLNLTRPRLPARRAAG